MHDSIWQAGLALCIGTVESMQGHFHLSHNYTRSISVVGSCAFVQTGVIGDCNRDGFRHSRVLKGEHPYYAQQAAHQGSIPHTMQ